MKTYDLIVIGGGAAGIFAAIAAKTANPSARVIVLEKTAKLLAKVRISGGGRCNVTHNCFDPRQLVQNYPRGSKELLGPFHRFQPRDTVDWFETRGVRLKTEADGRIFPTTDRSQTIIGCLLAEAEQLKIPIQMQQRIESITKDSDLFHVDSMTTRNLLLATGSAPKGHTWATQLGHSIISPVPSLFTFNVPTSPLKELSGIAHDPVRLHLPGTQFEQTGPLLLTHFGFSGPAALKLSAWAARFLYEKEYKTNLVIDWLPGMTEEAIFQKLFEAKQAHPKKTLNAMRLFPFSKNLWRVLVPSDEPIGTLSDKLLRQFARRLHADVYPIDGKTTNKEEFVTCGGVSLKEIDFKTMQSKVCPGLFFAGEILDIDGVTGGFNFQNAWTTGFIAGSSSVMV